MKKFIKNLLLLSVFWMTAISVAGHAMDTSEPSKPQSPSDRRANNFRSADLNGDGYVSSDEFAQSNHLSSASPISNRDIRASRIMAAFETMDKNTDGRISGKEYISYMEKNGS